MVVFATSFHWIDTETRVKKIESMLRPGRRVAVIETHHIDGGTAQFFKELQKCYWSWDDNAKEDCILPELDEVYWKDLADEFSKIL